MRQFVRFDMDPKKIHLGAGLVDKPGRPGTRIGVFAFAHGRLRVEIAQK
jgi:hypothetical protein